MFKRFCYTFMPITKNGTEYKNKYAGLYRMKFLCYIFLVFNV